AQLVERDLLGRADRAARVQRATGFLDLVASWRVDVDADLLGRAEDPAAVLLERDEAPAGEVEHRGRQRPPRRGAVHDHRAGRGGQVGRWGRDVDRGVVEVDRVLAE